MYDTNGREATKGARSTCPVCDGTIVAKVGTIVTPHWAHLHSDCDVWAEPETEWHRSWKRWLRDERGAALEVTMKPHRADAVLPSGRVVELQYRYQSPEQIAAREAFYGDMMWVYRCTWRDRLQMGGSGFWWKHGSKSMATHQRPVWWDMGNELWRVKLAVKGSWCSYGYPGEGFYSSPYRVLGKVVDKQPRSSEVAA